MSASDRTLEGKIALVTGGSRGIGRATAARLAAAGASVAFTWLTNRTGAEETEAILRARGGANAKIVSIRANVGNEEHLDKAFAEVRDAFGALDIFVSNAASGIMKPALELGEKDWARSMDVNALALLRGAQRAAPLMAGRDARILAVTSSGSGHVIPDYAAVGASKAAMEAIVRYLAVELVPRGIIVNAVSAGVTETNSLRFLTGWEEMLRDTVKRTPAGRAGTPEDIADIVYLLSLAESRWIVGQTIVADGGYSLLA
jgi:enoyl-[acyl-carrier protein] reductase III